MTMTARDAMPASRRPPGERIVLALALSVAVCTPLWAQQQQFPEQFDRIGIQRGNPDAEVVVREFADYQCPACRSFAPVVKQIIEEYVESGQVRFVFFDFPLDMHEHAVPAAEAARCAGLQDAYWPMHDALFEHQPEWSEADDPVERFGDYADQIGLDGDALERCVNDNDTREAVMQSRSLAGQLRVRSTPTLLINNSAVSGGRSWEQIRQMIESELSGESDQQAASSSVPELDPDRELQTVEGNRMDNAASPYLALHADNPVDWYPWGEEAFEKAREENKPIFLSIGYFTCYWCHVMERESFSDDRVADLLNRHFVAIKVDREQRPGVDSLYMRAINILGQRGGWPLSIFLTPDRKPFFGGTYYPKSQFISGLNQIHRMWADQPDRIVSTADQVVDALKQSERAVGVDAGGEIPGTELLEAGQTALAQDFDAQRGGFGAAPKFPQPSNLVFLLDRHRTTDSKHALEMVTTTLDAMASGGIWDHLGGGFHRYSTDADWHVPHFEKMLYDNAQLLEVYARAWEITGKERYRDIVEGIVRYLDNTLTDSETGLLYSAQSSLVHEQEGESYIWTREQVSEVLKDDRQLEVATALYGLDGEPDLEGAHVLHRPRSHAEVAEEFDGLEAGDIETLHRQIDRALLTARKEREQAPVGTKHVLSWNALTARSLAYAGRVMEDPALTERAGTLIEAVMEHMYRAEGGPWLALRAGHAGEVKAQSLDYAALTGALLELARTTGDEQYRRQAARVAADMIERLWNAERGLFNRRANADELLVETTDLRDSAVPAGNSLAALSLTELARTADEQFAPYAATVLRAHGALMDQRPRSLPLMLTALSRYRQADLVESAAIPGSQLSLEQPPQTADASASGPGLELEGVGGGTAASGSESLFSGEKVSMQVQRIEDDLLDIELQVDEGWHINANPASLEFLVATDLSVFHDQHPLSLDTRYPQAHQIQARELGEGPIDVYSGTVGIQSRLPDSVSAEDELTVVMAVQACNETGRCLAPDELEDRIEKR